MKMRSMLWTAAALVSVVVGCGGAGTTSEGSTEAKESNLAVDCSALLNDVNKLRDEVTACNPAGNAHQCTLLLDDICCPVTAAGGPIEKFKDAVAKYTSSCTYYCPAIACRTTPTNVCQLDGQCAQH